MHFLLGSYYSQLQYAGQPAKWAEGSHGGARQPLSLYPALVSVSSKLRLAAFRTGL
jgi:hypothetical protein